MCEHRRIRRRCGECNAQLSAFADALATDFMGVADSACSVSHFFATPMHEEACLGVCRYATADMQPLETWYGQRDESDEGHAGQAAPAEAKTDRAASPRKRPLPFADDFSADDGRRSTEWC